MFSSRTEEGSSIRTLQTYTWRPKDSSENEIMWSSYVNQVELSIRSASQPDDNDFRSVLRETLQDLIEELGECAKEVDYKDPKAIGDYNERQYTRVFVNRVINSFPEGWELSVSE